MCSDGEKEREELSASLEIIRQSKPVAAKLRACAGSDNITN